MSSKTIYKTTAATIRVNGMENHRFALSDEVRQRCDVSMTVQYIYTDRVKEVKVRTQRTEAALDWKGETRRVLACLQDRQMMECHLPRKNKSSKTWQVISIMCMRKGKLKGNAEKCKVLVFERD